MLFCALHFFVLLGFAILVNITFPMESPSYPVGSFWHVSDFHLDQHYSRSGNPYDLCHGESKNKTGDNGYYGNILCDSPQTLVDLTIKEMRRLHPRPDFVIWTGDNMPHTRNPYPDWNAVFETLRNVTILLHNTFSPSKIFPCIGNHDTNPPNILKPSCDNGSIYDDYLERGAWKTVLSEVTWSTFKKGGYYSYQINQGLRIVSLNTILWYESNPLVKNLTDPCNQFEWFENELKNASLSHEKVYIIGHVLPGFYNRVNPGKLSAPTFHPQYLRSYLKIVKEQSSVIAGQFFGHVHNDMFQLYYCNSGYPQSSSLIASSVTPWHTTHEKNSLPVNPSVRLMLYDKTKYTLMDYEQYFLNLTDANTHWREQAPVYKLLYTFTEVYGVPDLSTRSLVSVFEMLKSSSELYDKFFFYMTSAEVTVPCDNKCRSAQLCAMSCTSEAEYSTCMHTNVIANNVSSNEIFPSRHTDIVGNASILLNSSHYVRNNSHVVAYTVTLLFFAVLMVTVLIIYFKKRQKHYQKFSSF